MYFNLKLGILSLGIWLGSIGDRRVLVVESYGICWFRRFTFNYFLFRWEMGDVVLVKWVNELLVSFLFGLLFFKKDCKRDLIFLILNVFVDISNYNFRIFD